MKKILYIHAGAPKTGSSSIQAFCYDNRKILSAEYDLYYPHAGTLPARLPDTGSKKRDSHGYLFMKSTKPGSVLSEFGYEPSLWKELGEEIAKQPQGKILVSNELDRLPPEGSEGFCGWSESWLDEIRSCLPGCDIKVIYYVRRIDDYLKSLCNQWAKVHPRFDWNYSRCLDYYYNPLEGQPFLDPLRKFIGIMGRENVIARIYSRQSLRNGDVVDDIFHVMGIDVSGVPRLTDANLRVGDEVVPILHALNAADLDMDYDVRMSLHKKIMDRDRIPSPANANANVSPGVTEMIEQLDELLPGYKTLFNEKECSFNYPEIDLPQKDSLALNLLFSLYSRISEIQNTHVYNDIIANSDDHTYSVFLPGSSLLVLEKTDGGRKCFHRGVAARAPKRTVLGTAVQKAEVTFLGAVLENLSFRDAGVCSLGNAFQDFRGKEAAERVSLSGVSRYALPYAVQARLVLPGQFMLGHLRPDEIVNSRIGVTPLVILRDLREVLSAAARFQELRATKNPEKTMITADSIVAFMRRDYCLRMFELARFFHQQRENAHIVHFEELVAGDECAPSFRELSASTGCEINDVVKAVANARTSNSMQFYLRKVESDDCWNDEVEEAFCEMGFDLLNEALGYKRRL